MKTKNLILLVVVLAILTSCQQAHEATPRLQSTDSLAQLWINAWNEADVDAITASFDTDALLVTDTIFTGREAIKAGFVTVVVPMFRNLTCKKLGEQINDNLAWQTGSYVHEWVKKDSTVEKATGYYSMVWKKQEDKSWKLVVFHTN